MLDIYITNLQPLFLFIHIVIYGFSQRRHCQTNLAIFCFFRSDPNSKKSFKIWLITINALLVKKKEHKNTFFENHIFTDKLKYCRPTNNLFIIFYFYSIFSHCQVLDRSCKLTCSFLEKFKYKFKFHNFWDWVIQKKKEQNPPVQKVHIAVHGHVASGCPVRPCKYNRGCT